jgi:Flp pilus assembly protein TadG
MQQRHRQDGYHGQALVEFALVIGILLSLAILTIGIFQMILVANDTQRIAARVAEYVSVTGTAPQTITVRMNQTQPQSCRDTSCPTIVRIVQTYAEQSVTLQNRDQTIRVEITCTATSGGYCQRYTVAQVIVQADVRLWVPPLPPLRDPITGIARVGTVMQQER